jgi:site-specific recombinase XerD
MDLSEFAVVPEPTAERLSQRQRVDYRTEREDAIKWLLAFGIDPKKANGYAETTVQNRIYRMDQFYRFVWDTEDRYTTAVTHDHADAWMQELAYADCSDTHRDLCQKAVRMLFKWRAHERGDDEWDPEISFTGNTGTTTPRDYLTLTERTQIREAALEYGSIPSYNNVSPRERSDIAAYLAQRFEKPVDDITQADWERANNWKIPSLVSVSLDAALRPIEVERAVTSWVDLDNGLLRIPIEDSSKNEDNWRVSLGSRSVNALRRWLAQRDTYELYDGREELWLTREGNPYASASLRRVLHELCEIAGIDYEDRQMSWYTIRHSTGTYMTREEDLAAAQTQLRHKSSKTTMKYDQVPVEDRQDALDRIG